jgi:tRNA threonylcarbamoyl adenosine modification protein (Sua5/YciO/YrdC/YwlC family)
MRLWRIDGEPDDDVIAAITEILLGGGVVLLPTDTIYGFHAAAADASAVARVVALKGRGEEKPFVVIAASTDQLRALGADVPAALETIWPAPLTAVLRRGEGTVAARVPDLPWLRRLLERSGPLVSTSANRAGEPPISSIDGLAKAVVDGLDAALDAGPRAGKPSTIVDFSGSTPYVLREGDPDFTQNLRKTLRISL